MDNNKAFYQITITTFLMAAISGFSDVFCFISLDHLFTAHITGNIVIVIALIISHMQGIMPKLLAIPLFMILAALISVAIETHGINRFSMALWISIEILLFTLLTIIGVSYIPSVSVNSMQYLGFTMLPIGAMAIHNTLLRTHTPNLPPCTVMTGNLTQFIVDTTNYALSIAARDNDRKQRAAANIKRFGDALLGFIFGGLLSTVGFIYLKFYGLVLIIALLLMQILSLYIKK